MVRTVLLLLSVALVFVNVGPEEISEEERSPRVPRGCAARRFRQMVESRPQQVPPPPPPPIRYPTERPRRRCGTRERDGAWSTWSRCSCDGVQYRRRNCIEPHCSTLDSQRCYAPPLCQPPPEPQSWSDWCEWSECKSSCGPGERVRTRYCYLGTRRCEGKDYEIKRCDSGPCPKWSHWEDWSACSATCGHGRQSRDRTCLGGQYGSYVCPGNRVEERRCDLPPCTFWAHWQAWSACSVSCGDGVKRRTRICQYGTDCPGEPEDSLFCFGPPCAAFIEWSEWTECSAQCGVGQKTRNRLCISAEGDPSEDCIGDTLERILCNEGDCNRWSAWAHWSQCDRACGGGTQYRQRECTPSNAECAGEDRQTRPCNTQVCSAQCQWTHWYAWGQCSECSACRTGIRKRLRQCVGEPGCACKGVNEEAGQCRGEVPCRVPEAVGGPQPC